MAVSLQVEEKALRQVVQLIASITLLAVMAPDAAAETGLAYEGRRLFTSHCLLCHGPEGASDGPLAKKLKITPANLTVTVRSRSDTILKKIITGEGRQTITGRDRHDLLSSSMPQWKDVLTDEQIDALIAYLRFLGRSKHELMGDPIVGQELYSEYCQVCHGENGEGDGMMTEIMDTEPMDHSNNNATERFSNEQLANSILNGVGDFMPAWRGVLSQQDVEALVSYIRLLSY